METIQDRTLAALVHSINLRERRWQDTYIDDLVTYVLMQPHNDCRNAADIGRHVRELHVAPVEVYATEIEESISRLKAKHTVIQKPTGSLALSDNCLADANAKVREWQQLEAAVRDEWLGSIRAEYPSMSGEELDSLWRSLIDGFVAPLILSCGAESVRVMGGTSKRGQEPTGDIKRALAAALASLPEPLREVAECTFAAFLDTDGQRRQYLMELVSLVFNLYSLDLPTTVLEQVTAKHPLDLNLLLDTNLLYSLLGIDDTAFNQAVTDLVAIARRAKEYSQGRIVVRLRCDEATIEEFSTGLESRAYRWGNVTPSDIVAEIASEVCQLDGVVRAYFRQIEETHEQISMSDFVNVKIQSLKPYLSSQGVEIVASLPPASFRKQEIDDDINDWSATLAKKGITRRRAVLNHDVVLWHSVRLLRPSFTAASGSFLEPIYVLTCDNHFIDFDRSKTGLQVASEPNKAICMLPATLFHMLSIFVPRTDDFDRAFLHSLRMPILGTHETGTEQAAEDIVRTIATWKSIPREIAVATLSDQALLNAVSKSNSPEGVAGLVDASLADQIEGLEASRQELEKMKDAAAHVLLERNKTIGELKESLDSRDAAFMGLRSEFDATRAQLTQMQAERESVKKASLLRRQRVMQDLAGGAWSVLVGVLAYLLLRGNIYSTWLSTLERTFISAISALGMFLARYARDPHRKAEMYASAWGLTACTVALATSLGIRHQSGAATVLGVLTALEPVVFLTKSVLWVVRKLSSPGRGQDTTQENDGNSEGANKSELTP